MTPAEQIFVEEGRKAIATILLSAAGRRTIVIPSREEWVGVNLLERDDGLPARREFACILGLTDQETKS